MKKGLIVLVCGGREYNDRKNVDLVLSRLHAMNHIIALVHGDARGADTLADRWARKNRIPVFPYPADWERDGKAAGPIRNAEMLKDSQPDMVVAFPGGRGTEDMVKRAEVANINVMRLPL